METSIETQVRCYLEKELRRRKAQNTRYSLRAFARDLDISPALLSMVINGHRRVTKRLIRKIDRRSQSGLGVLISRDPKKEPKVQLRSGADVSHEDNAVEVHVES